MTEETRGTHSEDDDGEESPADLKQRVKEYVLGAIAWIRAQLAQSADEIAPQLRGAVDDLHVPRGAWKPIGLAAVILFAAVALGPAAPFASDSGPVDNGTEPVVGTTYEPVDEGEYRQVVSSRLGSLGSDAPPAPNEVRASAGSQTMSVETSVRDGDPVIVLEDDRTHEGRWVALETSWFEQHVGGVPEAAYVEHESGNEYASPIETRGGEAAFYVQEFSTNTVSFDGEFAIDASPATDGDSFEYDTENGGEDLSINVTGLVNEQWNNVSRSAVGNGDTVAVDVGGTIDPKGPSANDEPVLTLTGYTNIDTAYRSGDDSLKYADDSGDITDTGNQTNGVGGIDDIDGDNDLDIVYRDGSNVLHYVDKDGNDVNTGVSTHGVGGVGDIDGDGDNEVIYNSAGDVVKYYETDGTSVSTDASADSVGGVGDIDGDGDMDIAFKDLENDLSYVDANGNVVDTGVQATSVGGVGDIDGDGDVDIAYADTGDVVSYIDSGGNANDLTVTAKLGGGIGGVADTDADGNLEIAFIDTDGNVAHIDADKEIQESGVSSARSIGGAGDIGDDTTTDPAVDIDGDGADEVTHSGTLTGDKTVEISSLSLSDDSSTVSTSSGTVGVSFEFRERTETRDPVVEVNGETTGVDGKLADGETVSVTTNDSWLQEGTNRVNVSTNSPASGPASVVGLDYRHDVSKSRTINYSGEAFSERYNLSESWNEDTENASLTIPWASDRVIELRSVSVEHRDANGDVVQTLDSPTYAFENGEVVVELGDVNAGWETTVSATGSKVQVDGADLEVLDPTDQGEDLNSTVRLNNPAADVYVRVGETEQGQQLHYLENSSWDASEASRISADGTNELHIQNAPDNGEAQLRTLPLAFNVQSGAIDVDIPDDRVNEVEPVYRVVPGEQVGDEYSVTFVDAKDAQPYVLYDETDGLTLDQGLAESPLTLSATEPDSPHVLQFREDDGSVSGSGDGLDNDAGGGGPGPMELNSRPFSALSGLVPGTTAILVGLAGLVGLAVVSRETSLFDEGTRSDAVADATQDVAGRAGGLFERVLSNEIVVAALMLGGGAWLLSSGVFSGTERLIVALGSVPVAMYLTLQQFDTFDFRVWVGSTAVVAVLGVVVLAPGIFETVAREAGILIVVGVVALGWKGLSVWRAEASTPDEQTNVTFEVDDDDGS